MELPDFKIVFRGYDQEPVDQAWEELDRQLSEANATNKELRLQINSLREQNTEWGNRIKQYEQMEKDLRDALISAQRIATQVKEEATIQANELLLTARSEFETMINEANRISELKENEADTLLIKKRAEIDQVDDQLKNLVEQKTELQTQVDQCSYYLEMAKGVLKLS